MSAPEAGAPLLSLWQAPAPFSPVSVARVAAGEASSPLFVESTASRRLIRELKAYADGFSRGRAFMLSGYPGAGKTTCVLSALEQVLAGQLEADAFGRPLPVLLDTPRLLGGLLVAPDARESAMADTLKQLAISLANASAEAFLAAFSRRVGQDLALAEVLAQLRVDLSDAPSLARLRAFWVRFDALEMGVLSKADRPGAGFEEVVALWKVLQVRQVATGQLTGKHGSSNSVEGSETRRVERSVNVTKAFETLFGALAGGAVGTATAMEVGSPLAGALVGVATALIGTVNISRLSSRIWRDAQTSDRAFVPDLSAAALPRLLPELVDHLRSVGLAPVLVFDELDKVADPSGADRAGAPTAEVIGALVGSLKAFIAERCFSVFLVDRITYDRFEHGDEWLFADRLYLDYTPRALHRHLDQALAIASPPPEGWTESRIEGERGALRLLTLFESRLRLGHARSLLAQRAAAGDGAVLSSPGVERTPRTRLAMTLQIAIEAVLETLDLYAGLAADPYAGQVVTEALYDAVARWSRGESRLESPTLEAGGPSHSTLVSRALAQFERLLTDPELLADATAPRSRGVVAAALGPLLVAGEWRFSADGRVRATPPVTNASVPPSGAGAVLQATVDRLSRLTDGQLNLEELVGPLLPRSPSWREVQDGLASGEEAVVGVFVSRLTARGATLHRLLLWAGAARRGAALAGAEISWSRAALLICEVLGLDGLDAATQTKRLEFTHLGQLLADPLSGLSQPASASEWEQGFADNLSQVEGVVDALDLDWVEAGWSSLQRRLERGLEGRIETPDFAELVAHLARVGPGATTGWIAGAPTLLDLSRIASAPWRDPKPHALAELTGHLAAVWLGFGEVAKRLYRTGYRPPEDRAAAPSTINRVLLVTNTAAGIASAAPPAQYAALAVSPRSLPSLKSLIEGLGLETVLVEGDIVPREQLPRGRQMWLGKAPTGAPSVESARSLGEALERWRLARPQDFSPTAALPFG